MEHKADRRQIPVLFLGKIHIAQAKQEEVTFDTLLLDEQAPCAQHLPKNLLWITTSNMGPAWPLEHPVPAGTLLLAAACPNRTACHGLPLGTGQHGVTGDGRVSRLQGLSDHKFLNSCAQEQGVWSKLSNDRWWTSRDPFWSRALPNPSVRNSSSYFFPPMWTWQTSLLGTLFGSVFVCRGGHGHRWHFTEQFLLRPWEGSRRSTGQNTSRSRLWSCSIAILLCHHRGKQLNPDQSIHVWKITNAFPRARRTLHRLNGGSSD